MSDPEWLPSTIVQSSAALVAIIGGLLVSRLVTLTSERGGLEQQLRELNGDITSTSAHGLELSERIEADEREDFLREAARQFYVMEVRTEDGLVEEVGGNDRGPSLAREFLRFVADFEPQLDAALGKLPDNKRPTSVDGLRRAGIRLPFDPAFEPVVSRMLEARRSRWDTLNTISLAGAMDPAIIAARNATSAQEWQQLLRDRDDATRRLDDLERKRALVLDRLSAIEPRGVVGTLGALAVVVALGIAFPVVVLAMRWPELTVPWRASLVVAFLVSVLAVGVYAYRLSRSLSSVPAKTPS